MKIISKLLATFFGIGHFPIGQGTLASLIILILYKFFLYRLHWGIYLGLTGIVVIVGVFCSSVHSTVLKKKDPHEIVIDEVAGQMLVLFRLNPSWPLVLSAFLLFRIFDITKPFPLRQLEKFPKGWGIMADDIMAAVYSGILIHLYLLLK
jgi:phosphatidylglycerophosphatase A